MTSAVVKMLPIFLLLTSAPAQTFQNKSVEPMELPSGSVPTRIFGNECVLVPGDSNFAARLRCKGADIVKDPSIIVSVVKSDCERTSEEMMEARRIQIDDRTPFFNVVWEQKFSPVSIPEVVGYSGFYQKSMGNRYWWETCGMGKLTRVSVVMFAPTDNEALKAEIEEKIFGIVQQTSVSSQDTVQ